MEGPLRMREGEKLLGITGMLDQICIRRKKQGFLFTHYERERYFVNNMVRKIFYDQIVIYNEDNSRFEYLILPVRIFST